MHRSKPCAYTAGGTISPDSSAANSIITTSAGTQASAVTDSGTSDTYCAAAVAYK
jgi:hypothetical protein